MIPNAISWVNFWAKHDAHLNLKMVPLAVVLSSALAPLHPQPRGLRHVGTCRYLFIPMSIHTRNLLFLSPACICSQLRSGFADGIPSGANLPLVFPLILVTHLIIMKCLK